MQSLQTYFEKSLRRKTTGAQPQVHGIQKKEKPVLTCDTIFDALIRSGKKIAIVAVKGSSIDLIFRKRLRQNNHGKVHCGS
jgi:hypothetical protein